MAARINGWVSLSALSQGSATVAYGATGQVRPALLHDDLFLPNFVERDQALRYDTGTTWPTDGVANVRPLQITSIAPEGLY